MANVLPKFVAEADLSEIQQPRQPPFKLCTMTPTGNLLVPRDVREKWLNDVVRSH